MATQLGNITKSLGREFGIIMSNMAGEDIFSNSSLRENSIIISSPINEETLEDKGTYNIFVTDGDGQPVRLSYTIKPGNGIITTYNGDVVEMSIDGGGFDISYNDYYPKGSICVDDTGTIFVNKTNIIDEKTLTVNNSDTGKVRGEIAVVTANLVKATDQLYGISKADERTTYIDPEYPGEISVNTQNLDTVDDKTNRDGIVKHSSETFRTIMAEDGKLTVLTYNLDKANESDFGVVKSDEETIHSDYGILSVITSGLEYSTGSSYGISKGDEKTIITDNGTLSVKTQNLDKATYDSLGVVIPDSYSLEVDENGKIYVRDFQSIESILDTNPKEHDLFSKDIEDLKNRVSILETMHEAETIEMLVPVGETRTILPKPVLNEQNQIENDPITKTVPFLLKTNCKYNVKVDYELNENPQVKVVSLQVGDKKYSSFSQEIFEETGNKTTTLNITFSVSNYTNKENNCDNVNTKVFVTVASINDSAIKQTATHIFNRWNTEAFTVDPEPIVVPDDPSIPSTSTLIIHKNSGKLENYYENDNSGEPFETNYLETNSRNYYFTYSVNATYTYNDTSGKIYSQEMLSLNQAAVDNVVPIIDVKEYDLSLNRLTNSTPEWLSVELGATYNTTKAFNVLNVKSTKGISEDRVAYITLTLPAVENVNVISDEYKIDQELFDDRRVDLTNTNNIIDELKRIKSNLDLIKVPATNPSVNTITRNVSTVKKSTSQIINTISEKIIDRSTWESLNQKFNNVLSDIRISENTLIDSIENSTPIELSTKITNVKKAKALEDLSYIQKIANTINSKYKIYIDIISKEANPSTEGKTITFRYYEAIKEVTPRIVVSSNIEKGKSYVTFKMERSKESIVEGNNNWGVNIKYNFVDKNNVPINTDGSTSDVKDYIYSLTASYNETSKESSATSEEIQTAQSGVYNTTTNEDRYYDLISINAEITNNNFLFISGNDTATIRFSSYSWDNGRGAVYSTIPDNIYLVLQCWNIASNKWIRTYNLKGYSSGKSFDLVDALNFKLIGLSLYSTGKNASLTIKNGNRKYKCGEGKIVPSDASSSSYKEKRGTAQVPIKVNNNIAGIKIIGVDIQDGSFKFVGDPYTISNPGNSITVVSSGSWINTDNSSNNLSLYSFGDAYVSNISISPWDDYEMNIKLHISPGSNTKIPLGATINNEFSNSYGKTNFIFLEDSSSYDYKQLYSDFEYTSSPWTNTGCDIYYRLYNKFNLNYDSVNKTKTIMYNNKTGVVSSVYTSDGIPYAKTHQQRDNTYDAHALLTKISAIKVWFTLSIQNVNILQKFGVSKSSISDKILLQNCNFVIGESKSVKIENAFYVSSLDVLKSQIGNNYNGISLIK